MALCAQLDKLDYRTYVLMGDGEVAEGAVWEAASLAGINKLNNLIGIVDVNRLGQSQETAFGHNLDTYKKRFEAFGWRTEEIDGHDLDEITEVLAAVGLGSQPLVILARTLKGAGISFIHALIREAVYEAISPSQRTRWHRMAGEALVAQPHPDADAFLELWSQTGTFETFAPAANALLFSAGDQEG